MKNKQISELEVKAIVDFEVKSAMGEIGGELSEERSLAMDYYLGEPVGKLSSPRADRSSVVYSTVRDTVEWIMPHLMRVIAQEDTVVEFTPVGSGDAKDAEQETQAVNHIFWRQNEGFLILYSWFKDALLQKNGIVKFWVDETETVSTEDCDALTDQSLGKLLEDEELEPIAHDKSETVGVDGSELHHVVFTRTHKEKKIEIAVVPPEQFLISNDSHSLDLQKDPPRFVGHYPEKTINELIDMGFSDEDIELMKKGDERWNELDEEWISRYNLSDEQEISEQYAHESMRKIRLVEGYCRIDVNGDGYSELLRIYRAGDFISYEETDCIPFSALTPNILSHKFFGLSIFDLVHDLQEVSTSTLRNVLDNMYQVNNTRPVVNERVDVDSLLTSTPGAPIYVDDEGDVGGAVMPFSPPPMWKDGLGLLEYLDGLRKDRTGIGDETMGLDASTLANANTGVVLSALETSRGKLELIVRIFAETGIKWLFRGIHELARKHYDKPMSYKVNNEYVDVRPSEWKPRTDMVVQVGTATGNSQQKQFALMQVADMQQRMVQGGLMGKTVIPGNIYQTGRDLANTLGLHGEKFFLNPVLLADPNVRKFVSLQVPEPPPDAQTAGMQAMAQAEMAKVESNDKRAQMEGMIKARGLEIREKELMAQSELDVMKHQLSGYVTDLKNQTEQQKMMSESTNKALDAEIKIRDQDLKAEIAQLNAEVEILKTSLSISSDIMQKEADVKVTEEEMLMNVLQQGVEHISDSNSPPNPGQGETVSDEERDIAGGVIEQVLRVKQESSDVGDVVEETPKVEDLIGKFSSLLGEAVTKEIGRTVNKPRRIKYDDEGKIVEIW